MADDLIDDIFDDVSDDSTFNDGVTLTNLQEADEQTERQGKKKRRRRKKRHADVTRNDEMVSTSDKADDGMEEVRVPQWALSIKSKREAGVAHAFMLSGNIRDYMMRQVSIQDGIIGMLDASQENFEVIATYNQADGLRFDLGDRYTAVSEDEYKRRFLTMMNRVLKSHGEDEEQEIPSDPCRLFSVIASIFDEEPERGEPSKMLLFVDYTELLVPDGASLQLRDSEKRLAIIIADMCRSYKADRGGSCVVFMTDALGQVNGMIRDTSSRVDQTNVPQPQLEQRRDFIKNVLDVPENVLSDGRGVLRCDDGVDAEYLAVNTAGLACYQVEDIVLRSIADDEPVTAENVKSRKNEIIKNDYNDVIEIMDPKYGFDGLGGMETVKRFFKEEVVDPIHEGDFSSVPLGVLMSGPPGSGKSLSWLTRIPTPTGMKQAKDIRVEDYLFDERGHITRVLGVYPQGKLEVYRVTLRDGRHIDCSSEHIFRVGRKSHGRYKWEDMTVAEMLRRGVYAPNADGSHPKTSKFYLPSNGCVDYPPAKQPVDAYVIGCFLGDGCATLTDVREDAPLLLSSDDKQIVDTIARRIGASGYHQRKGSYTWYFYHNDKTQIKSHDICQDDEIANLLVHTSALDKHIPERYLFASRQQRLELLRGLMDTDGCIKKTTRFSVEFCTTSPQLANDTASLVRSLGWFASVRCDTRAGKPINSKIRKSTGERYVHKHNTYVVRLLMPNSDKHLVFTLKRKVDIAKEASAHTQHRDYSRIGIASIKPLGEKEEMVCFYVDNPEHLFLAGDYIVTHNTVLAKAVAYESKMNCVALNMNNIFDKYVGQSERNLDRAIDCALSMAPTIIFIDEIDEALPKRHGEISGVNNRINKTMLTFMSETEHRGKVIILGCSNYPNMIDAAFKRAGRFDKRIPIFAPSGYDRIRIIKISCRKATDVNINGDNEPYQMSCLRSPDAMIASPFGDIEAWFVEGHRPENPQYVGDDVDYHFTGTDEYGEQLDCHLTIPKAIESVIGKRRITLQEFYRAIDGFIEMPKRKDDASTLAVESDASYYARITETLTDPARVGLFGSTEDEQAKNVSKVGKLMRYYDKYYKPFMTQTDHMTGAELDVVVQKAITLFRKWTKQNSSKWQRYMERGVLRSEKDIPWEVVLEAATKTTTSTASVKEMEDYALLDTSDTDFVPDAVYGQTKDGKDITYKQRMEELRLNASRND